MRTLLDVEYARVGEHRLLLDLYLPDETRERPWPLLVWIHGGGWCLGSKKDTPAPPFTAYGYAVASIAYRFSQVALFPAQVEDCKAAVRFLRGNAVRYGFDANAIGAWGASAGGYLSTMLATTAGLPQFETVGGHRDVSSGVQAVCDWYGPTDFLKMNEQAGPGNVCDHDKADSPESLLIGGPIQQNKDKAHATSPLRYISGKEPPFLIVHGDRDCAVPFAQSEMLRDGLQAAGVECTLRRLPGGDHGDKAFESPAVLAEVRAFFDRHLMRAGR